ncbi:hypothetical protein [Sphingomonas aracearum]|uniref:Transcription factor n=1 Tax=Sphingomonas aracearum TaxID=2283317 RepID=A0A369VXQ3_9SPHN|nr:hypothetical protein [Sphingomonas aracearum]RDE06913.1 hypothetical protein DVW87_04390 [Sphingomonas aracearum]
MAESDPSRPLQVDAETSGIVARLARRLGVTEVEAVRFGLREFEEGLNRTKRNPAAPEWLVRYWRDHPLPPSTGLVADKAFYDSLNDEDDE